MFTQNSDIPPPIQLVEVGVSLCIRLNIWYI